MESEWFFAIVAASIAAGVAGLTRDIVSWAQNGKHPLVDDPGEYFKGKLVEIGSLAGGPVGEIGTQALVDKTMPAKVPGAPAPQASGGAFFDGGGGGGYGGGGAGGGFEMPATGPAVEGGAPVGGGPEATIASAASAAGAERAVQRGMGQMLGGIGQQAAGETVSAALSTKIGPKYGERLGRKVGGMAAGYVTEALVGAIPYVGPVLGPIAGGAVSGAITDEKAGRGALMGLAGGALSAAGGMASGALTGPPAGVVPTGAPGGGPMPTKPMGPAYGMPNPADMAPPPIAPPPAQLGPVPPQLGPSGDRWVDFDEAIGSLKQPMEQLRQNLAPIHDSSASSRFDSPLVKTRPAWSVRQQVARGGMQGLTKGASSVVQSAISESMTPKVQPLSARAPRIGERHPLWSDAYGEPRSRKRRSYGWDAAYGQGERI